MKEFYVPYIKKESDIQRIENVSNIFKEQLLPDIMQEVNTFKSDANLFEKKNQRAGFLKQVYYLSKRTAINLIRNPLHSRVRIFQTIIMSIIIIICYYKVNGEKFGRQKIQDLMGGMYFISVNNMMGGLFSVLLTFQQEREVFL